MIYIGHVPRRKSVAIGITENGRTRVVGYLRNEDDAEDLIIAIEAALATARETAVKRVLRDTEIQRGETAMARAYAAHRAYQGPSPLTRARGRAE